MKIAFCALIVLMCGLLGHKFGAVYTNRKKFFASFLIFLNTIKVDINFSAKKIEGILKDNTISQSKQLNKLIQNYKNILQNGCNYTEESLFKDITILNKDEQESIFLFFKNLGRLDVFNQVDNINSFIDIIQGYSKKTLEDCNKYGALYTKLGIIIGAFIVLLIV